MFELFLTEAQKKLQQEVRDFVKSVPRQLIIDMDAEKVEFPYEFVREAGRRNLLGLRVPNQHGGRGLKWVDEMIALMEIGKLGLPFNCLYDLTAIVTDALNIFGTEAQKDKYIRPLVEGRQWAGEALTEPRGGSDFFGATTRARKEGRYYILNGQKRFTVGAEGADFFLVYATTKPEARSRGLSCFIVEKDMGVEVKHIYGLMGSRGTGTGRLLFRNVQVPEENLLGEENKGSQVFYRMMVPERFQCGYIGRARSILEIAARYANKRKAFGQTIRNFEAVSFKIADSITKIDAVTAYAYTVARILDEGVTGTGYQRRLISQLKKLSSEMLWEVVNNAMQILGGIGYTNVFPVERALREARLPLIWTGTSEIQNLVIQHEYYKELLDNGVEGRNFEGDVPLAEAELEEEKVYESELI
ncbi:MAG TPA: acyl-CoA/acyl-ACP dehydrogenase [Dehalococcoidia bacterium]|nr:acyl-CoA/acyl-ACP dehydrogenase [Dehalococcoidia bacterium]